LLWRVANGIASCTFVRTLTGAICGGALVRQSDTVHSLGYFADRLKGTLTSRITDTSNGIYTVKQCFVWNVVAAPLAANRGSQSSFLATVMRAMAWARRGPGLHGGLRDVPLAAGGAARCIKFATKQRSSTANWSTSQHSAGQCVLRCGHEISVRQCRRSGVTARRPAQSPLSGEEAAHPARPDHQRADGRRGPVGASCFGRRGGRGVTTATRWRVRSACDFHPTRRSGRAS